MKVEIRKDGVLAVTAESELEAYALQCWGAGSIKRSDVENAQYFCEKLLINFGLDNQD